MNTGVITDANAPTRFLRQLLTNVDRHLDPEGHALLGYLKRSPSTDCLFHLGLLDRPSNNAIFWEHCTSMERIKEGFVDRGYDAGAIDLAFSVFAEQLYRHRALIENLGEAYMRAHDAMPPPPEFFDNCADLGRCHLTQASEQSLLHAIEEHYVIVDRFQPDRSTAVLAWRRR